ncbi:DUF1127 domain-containing protein [Rhizobium sp. AQ_MP]|uniref:DUF1127 domain-containing protein n=1 Tax=Rhizobium sp. AQ_MP TaxID=2761536 RepID=UPI001FF011AA|nr:DUF1127 domain-containing protein [Rhizobium sp. AQ_MP]
MVTILEEYRSATYAQVPAPPMGTQQRLIRWITRVFMLRRTRNQIADLTPDQLKDIGITPEEAMREIRRSRLLWIDRPLFPPL